MLLMQLLKDLWWRCLYGLTEAEVDAAIEEMRKRPDGKRRRK